MVTVAWRCASVRAAAIGALLFGISACSAFDPVKETRFTLLNPNTYAALGMPNARWVAYDDQHSFSAACTNGAAGNHAPSECAVVYVPWSDWQNPKCPPTEEQLSEGYLHDPGPNGHLCVRGVLHPLLPCGADRKTQCFGSNSGDEIVDQSNMWGAGVGLVFSPGNEGWDAPGHKVRGVAFDFDGPEETRLNLRVGIPIVLDSKTLVPPGRPFMRSDGSVLGTDGKIYDCDSNDVSQSVVKREETRLIDAVVDPKPGDIVTSERHPYGSPFWQLPSTTSWDSSPVKRGHNEFEWPDIAPPPEAAFNYLFDETQILGIHFQVVPPKNGGKNDLNFELCITNLAFLLE